MAETGASLKRETSARVVMLGPEPLWKRGLQNEVLRYYVLHHRLIPAGTNDEVSGNGSDEALRTKLAPQGAEFISAWDVSCDGKGCLARLGAEASDISASDMIKGSEFMVRAVIDRVLDGQTADEAAAAH